MIEIRRILCPIDFSDYSRHALDHAVAIARWYDSAITVLHVYSTAPVAAYAPGSPEFAPVLLTAADRDQVTAEMKRFVDEEAAPGVSIEPAIREGNVAREILNQAAEMKADLVVLGTHGRSGFERLILGSITEKVLRKASCPVLTVPRHHPDAVPSAPVIFKHILCPVDFSDCSMKALNYAMSLAQEADAHLTVLHVIAYELEGTPEMPDAIVTDERLTLAEFRRQREAHIARRLKDAIPESVAEYCSVESVVTRGVPGREILRIASERQSDLLVMGVHGRGAADLLFFGSTTQRVVREATCPVLTLRQG